MAFLFALVVRDRDVIDGDFEQQLLTELRSKNGDILTAIRDSGELASDVEDKLKGVLDAFAKTFA